MQNDALDCTTKARRRRLFGNPSWNGIDYVEVVAESGPPTLCVHFFGAVPENVGAEQVRIRGGRRIRDLRVEDVRVERAHDEELDDCLRVELDRTGDFSTYELCLVEPSSAGSPERPLDGFDPRYACGCFRFRLDCSAGLDCKSDAECDTSPAAAPEINYLAKDYASFRQLMLDRLALTAPAWQERHAPDLGVTLVELLAYTADYLSYYQDAVGTEAYLDTARLRTSVRRHARLVDYAMHEGVNARAWVTVATASDLEPLKASDFYFITGFGGIEAASGRVVDETSLERVPPGSYEVFEPLVADASEEVRFRAAHSRIRIYTWGDEECCLPAGATRATLLDEADSPPGAAESTTTPGRVLDLKRGDVLVFEEVIGARTGNPADADPAHRHAVRLTSVTPNTDGLLGKSVLEVEWGEEDRLPFALCLSVRLPAPACSRIDDVSVARGNVVLVDHGRRTEEPLGPVGLEQSVQGCACDGAVVEVERVPARFRPRLAAGPLTFSEPVPSDGSASALGTQDPRRALPVIALVETATDADAPATWSSRRDLLQSGDEDRDFVVETDDTGTAELRFGDGTCGRMPDADTSFLATYRVGNGTAGNVGRDAIRYLVLRGRTLSADRVEPTNPLPARGGTEPEPVSEVKLLAPHAFRRRRERAVTAADYAELAERNTKLERAAAELRWTGSWYEARVAVDPLGTEDIDPALLADVEGSLFRYRRMGHDLTVVGAREVPLHVVLEICVLPDFDRGHVRAEVQRVLGNRVLSNGKLGFFHPDNLSFGTAIHASRLIAVVKAVAGVETVRVRTLERADGKALGMSGRDETQALELSGDEVARLDNDPNFPENGSLELVLGGGR